MIIENLDQLDKIVKKIYKRVKKNDCILLEGEIGVGKTTFTKKLIHHTQSVENVKFTEVLSPTYNLLYEYKINRINIKHYDLYRIEKKDDLKNLGILNDEEICIKIIEWPKLVFDNYKDKLLINIFYEKEKNTRRFDIKGYGSWKDFSINEL